MLDDPYFFLYFGDAERPPSYLSLDHTINKDNQHRVLRFDSFSKVFSGGIYSFFAHIPGLTLRVTQECVSGLLLPLLSL